jgi:DNA-binding CsgD family transcriptional regulator
MCPPTAPPADHSPDDHSPDDLVELEFELTDSSYPFVGLSAEESCEVRFEGMIRPADGSFVEFFTARGGSVGTIRELADRTDLIDSVRVGYETDREVLFQLTIPGQCIAVTVEEAGALPQSIVAADGTGRVTALVPDGVVSRDVVESIGERHPTLELVAHRRREVSAPVFTATGLRQSVRRRLTERQWEVLRTAYRNGYWERPRQSTGEEIAEELGISSATFSQHVRSAHRNLFDLLFDEETRSETE